MMQEFPPGINSISERDATGALVVHAEEDEEVKYVLPGVRVVFDQEEGVEDVPGTLYVTTRRVAWLGRSKGLGVGFRAITMHAISRDPDAHARPCIYTQIEAGDSFGNEDDEDIDITEMRIVPEDSEKIDELFRVLCDCAALNPDLEVDQEDDAGEFFVNEEEIMNGVGAEDRIHALDRFDALLEMPTSGDFDQLISEDPGRFEDDEDTDYTMQNGPQ